MGPGRQLNGVIHGIHTFLPRMIEQKTEGHIINTASVSGLINDFMNMPCAVSKHAVVALSENLYLELKSKNEQVNVSVVCPGPVNTNTHHSVEHARPEAVPPPPPLTKQGEVFLKAQQRWLERGLDPVDIGQQVLTAIKEEHFHITPHDVSRDTKLRMQGILDKRNPVPPPPPEDFMAIIEDVMEEDA